jgi:preprotein translocase subunit SecE
MKASSSIGRALVSKTSGCGFNSCLACRHNTALPFWAVHLAVLLPSEKKEFDVAGKGEKNKGENRIQRFFRETLGELRKVSWPTWPEARNLTIVVIIVLVVMAIFLWVVDLSATGLLTLIIGA